MVLLEIGIAVIVVIVVAIIVMFNGFVSKRNRVQDAWSQIDVQLKRRYDLIPNLVETVRGYMKYEQGVLTKITALRSSIVSGSVQDKAQANNQITQALKTIFAVAENYPQLKASESYQNLQNQLAETEDKIAFMRTSYNDYVLDFNNAIQTFPGNVLAGMFHFSRFDFFQTPEQERGAVKVNLTDTDTPGVSFGTSGQPQQPPQTPKQPKK